ncbi:MAG: hypothetical protein JNL67_00455 [Planctomycetaceae bacterium]|nr:hypothetical protein [Planctomycetaceae bacterium]
MSRLSPYQCLLTALVYGMLTTLIGSEVDAQRLRPRPITPRNNPPASSTKGTARDASGNVAKLLHSKGLAYYRENPGDLLVLIRQSVEGQRKFADTAQNRSPWGVMHTTLAWGPPGEILIDDKTYNAINALCDNQRLKGVRLLAVQDGLPHPLEGPGLQGHPGQLLAILAQNNVPLTHPIRIADQTFSVADLVAYEKKTCKPNMELTFKLLGLSHYLPLDEIWTAEDGGTWSVERLLRLELRQPINGQQTCGGTHRLMAIHLAAAKRIREGGDVNGAWAAASQYIEDYHEYALSLINPDGSCSTDWLERRAALDDPQRRVQTTGHVLEWLAVSLPNEKLLHDKLVGSFAYLSALLMVDIGETWSVGPRAHALRALRIYHDRLASVLPGTPAANLDRLAREIEVPGLESAPTASLTDTGPSDPPSAASGTGTAAPAPGTDTLGPLAPGTDTTTNQSAMGTDTARPPALGTDTARPAGPLASGTGTARPPALGTDTARPAGPLASGTDTAAPASGTGTARPLASVTGTAARAQGTGTEGAPAAGTGTERVAALPGANQDDSKTSSPSPAASGSAAPAPVPTKPGDGAAQPKPSKDGSTTGEPKGEEPVPELAAAVLDSPKSPTPTPGTSILGTLTQAASVLGSSVSGMADWALGGKFRQTSSVNSIADLYK